MAFGGQTVTFVTVAGTGVFDDFGSEVTTETEVPVAGCLHRPLSAQETPDWLTDIATQIWKTTAPPGTETIAAKSTGKLRENGRTFEIIGGAQPFTDMIGNQFKVTILSKIEAG